MKNIICALLILTPAIQTSFYSLEAGSAGGSNIAFSQFEGKKVLIVNVASGSSRVGQLAQLQELYELHSDSLEIIAFPSNSFGNEPLTNEAIQAFMQNNYGVTFTIAAKQDVKGANIHPVYYWLTKHEENGMFDVGVRGDFQKFLVNRQGLLIGMYDTAASPLGEEILHGIQVGQ